MAEDGGPEILVDTDETRVIDEAIAALARAPELYVHGPNIVDVVVDHPTTRGVVRAGPVARMRPTPGPMVRELLARSATWLGRDRGGKPARVHPPGWVIAGVMARGVWPALRPLVGVMTAPTMRPDGTILSSDGYDERTAIYLAPDVAVAVSDAPTNEDARAALAQLLDLLCDFPATPAGKAAWLAMLLSVIVRPAIGGPIPMLIVSGTVAGTGKGLATDVLSEIALGVPAAKGVYSGIDAETRKLLTSVILVGDPLIVLDNLDTELGDAALDKVLTDTVWTDRVLGVSERVSIPVRLAVLATGNNIAIRSDMRRRALLMRLEAMVERPEERSGWRYPRLIQHVREHRAELLGAALTIARAYVVAGRPDMKLRPMGSYEAWTDAVRSAVVWAGCPDPCDTLAEVRASDLRTDAFAAMLAAWPAGDKETITAGELLERATPESDWRAALIEWCPPRGGAELPTQRGIGNALAGVRGRIAGDRMIESAGRSRKGALWVRLPPSERDSVYPVIPFLSLRARDTDRQVVGQCQTESPDSRSHTREPGEDDADFEEVSP